MMHHVIICGGRNFRHADMVWPEEVSVRRG